MSTIPTTDEKRPGESLGSSQSSKPQRVLACVLCQQRKVKCDRKYPCAHCIKSRVQCVPATQVSRRRRRRFPERELLERLRKYEDLLRKHNIKFEPLHPEHGFEKPSPDADGGYDSDDEQAKTAVGDQSSPSTGGNEEKAYQTKSMWHAMSKEFRDPDNGSDSSDDDVREKVIQNAWDEMFGQIDDDLLFGSRTSSVDISTLHPDPVHIFRLWQLYLENIDPLLKMTHTPSLQPRIIEAIGNVKNIKPTLEALMFSIYTMSVLNLGVDDCQAMFGMEKPVLLTRYQFGCQQALLNAGFLRGGDRDCLTALVLYLISVKGSTVPQSLSSMLGIAVRIAQRMGCHNEQALAKCSPLEAEMRRRLWWSLILYDARIGEMADYKTATLVPTWDCKIPLNVNDSDFRSEMKGPPQVQGTSTEAIFAVVRGELGNYVRSTRFHLAFHSPALNPIAKDVSKGATPETSEIEGLEKMIEDKYLRHCDPENPLHFMTIWTTRGYLAKCHFMEHLAGNSSTTWFSSNKTDTQQESAFAYAIIMLECDTKTMTSPLTQGFLWLSHIYFPFPAYNQILQTLKRKPIAEQAEYAWEVMSENFVARIQFLWGDEEKMGNHLGNNPFFRMFTELILNAWEAREVAFKQLGDFAVTPTVVLLVRQKVAQVAQNTQNQIKGQTYDVPVPAPMGFGIRSPLYGMAGQDDYAMSGAYPPLSGMDTLDADVNQLDWSVMNWDLENAPVGEVGGSKDISLHSLRY